MNALLQARGVETAHAPGHGPANPPQRILVVEDDALVRQFSVRALLGFGYQVDTAEDGAAGWEALQAGNHDLLLTDHRMPKVTGVELVQMLWSAGMILPVILVSGAPPTEELERHPWLKFAAILPKPFSSEQLLTTVKAALNAPDDARHHAGGPFSVPAAARRQSIPPPRWGLNE